MEKEYSYEELLHKAAAYTSASEHASSEVDKKLKDWGASPSDRKKIISYLKENNFIDEKRFSEAFVHDKFRFNKWGKIKIALHLKSKGIEEESILLGLSTIDEKEYTELLTDILKKKNKTVKADSNFERKGKLFQFAQSRGFEYGIIEKVLDTII